MNFLLRKAGKLKNKVVKKPVEPVEVEASLVDAAEEAAAVLFEQRVREDLLAFPALHQQVQSAVDVLNKAEAEAAMCEVSGSSEDQAKAEAAVKKAAVEKARLVSKMLAGM